MNKTDYIREIDELHAPDSLKDKIGGLNQTKAAKTKTGKAKRITAVIAACLAVAVLVGGAYGVGSTFSLQKSESGNTYNNFGDLSDSSIADNNETGKIELSGEASSQKLIKKARVFMVTKNADELIKGIDSELATLKGYTSALTQNKDDDSLSVETRVQVPAEKLDEFLAFLEKSGTITGKNIETSDVTDDYTDTESQIEALETEEKALLAILAKSETVQDTMSVQDRLAQVRGELNSLKGQKENYDRQIAYSEVSIYISEVDRVKKAPTSFGSQVSENFSESLYNIGQFFRNLGVFVLGASPYLVIVAVVAAAVILAVKKRKKK